MAEEIGSDVPFFILKSPALATGRGEVLRRVSLPGLCYILINPGFSVSTSWVYNNLDLTNKPEDNILSYSDKLFESVTTLVGNLTNDLEAVTLTKFPEISGLKKLLIKSGADGALMSGSGSTVFGLFTEEKRAEEAFRYLRDSSAGKGKAIFFARGLLKGQY
jgi:4-diphosphocytidyl-2-C-methyl-D-erythritol kinase